jgi:hypothetical protein
LTESDLEKLHKKDSKFMKKTALASISFSSICIAATLGFTPPANSETLRYVFSQPEKTLSSSADEGLGAWYHQYDFSKIFWPQFDQKLGYLNKATVQMTVEIKSFAIGYEYNGADLNTNDPLAIYLNSQNPPGINSGKLRGDVTVLQPEASDRTATYSSFCSNNYGQCSTLATIPELKTKSNYDGNIDYSGQSGITYKTTLGENLKTGIVLHDPRDLSRATGLGAFSLQYQANFFVANDGWSLVGKKFTEYKIINSAAIEYDFDRVGLYVTLALSGDQVNKDHPSYISSIEKPTVATLLDSELLAKDTIVDMSFVSASDSSKPFAEKDGAIEVVSDVLEMHGLDGKRFTLQMSYSEDQIKSSELNEDGLFLSWYNEADGRWENATNGNTHRTRQGLPFYGSYVSYLASIGSATPELGAYGIDTNLNKVWAVLDHNSYFAISEPNAAPVPEPMSITLLLSGGLALWLRHKLAKRTLEL